MIPYLLAALALLLLLGIWLTLGSINHRLGQLLEVSRRVAHVEKLAAGLLMDEITKPVDAQRRPWEERN